MMPNIEPQNNPSAQFKIPINISTENLIKIIPIIMRIIPLNIKEGIPKNFLILNLLL